MKASEVRIGNIAVPYTFKETRFISGRQWDKVGVGFIHVGSCITIQNKTNTGEYRNVALFSNIKLK